jgi:hypothetical protein
LITVEKIKARQRSKLKHMRYRDTNTKLFFLKANGRKRRKHIQFRQREDGLAMKHEEKAKEIENHFNEMLGTKQPRLVSLNWSKLDYPTYNLTELNVEITEEEIKKAITKMPK